VIDKQLAMVEKELLNEKNKLVRYCGVSIVV
jgi:hypothetical protein